MNKNKNLPRPEIFWNRDSEFSRILRRLASLLAAASAIFFNRYLIIYTLNYNNYY